MTITYQRGDLFKIAEEENFRGFALAHCISEDCVMGKGIAAEFKKRFAGVPKLKEQVAAGKKTGTSAVLKKDGRHIFYLITKKTYKNKPTYETLKNSLIEMREMITKDDIEGVLMPKIGCGLDRLEWTKVADIINKARLKNTG